METKCDSVPPAGGPAALSQHRNVKVCDSVEWSYPRVSSWLYCSQPYYDLNADNQAAQADTSNSHLGKSGLYCNFGNLIQLSGPSHQQNP